MSLRLAYLSQGKLFFKHGDLAVRQIESQFGQEIVDRALSLQQRREWKTRGREGTYFSGAMLWGVSQNDPRITHARITGVTPGSEEGKLYYILETEAVGGLLLYDWQQDSERRIFHKESFWVNDMDCHPEDNTLICSRNFQNGTANLARLKGFTLHEITEGDSVDAAPSWVLGSKQEIVFQSAGVGRNASGFPIGLGPFCIEKIELEKGTLTTLLEDPEFDFLLPHMTAAGDLYFIRRPYEDSGKSNYSFLNLVTDVLLFPFRLIRTIFHFLDFMSQAFSKRGLTTAGGPKTEEEEQKTILLRGKIIDAQKAMREAGNDKTAPALVPNSWELVRRQANGEETVLAKGVVAFDLDATGNLIYTDGSAVYGLDQNGKAQRLLKDRLIQDVVIV